MEKMPSGKGGEGGTEQEIFEGFLEKATQTIVYILSRSIRKKAPKRVFRAAFDTLSARQKKAKIFRLAHIM